MNLVILAGLAEATGGGGAVSAFDVVTTRIDAMPLRRYTLGATVRLTARFGNPETLLDPSGDPAPVDPSLVEFRLLDPLGFEQQPDVFREEVGLYAAFLQPRAAGTWHYRIESSGEWAGAAERDFIVDASAFAVTMP
jgi:hypothetical protein